MEIFNCACGNEAITVSSCEDFIEISIWERKPSRTSFNFLTRLRWCWYILTTGHLWNDSILLDKKEARRFLKHLSRKLNYR